MSFLDNRDEITNAQARELTGIKSENAVKKEFYKLRDQARLAALLLTVMYASFTPLVHIPLLLADPTSHGEWSENALNLTLTAVAWVMCDSLTPSPRNPRPGV